MILGRPTGLWLGLATAATGFITLVAGQIGYPIPAEIVAAFTLLLGAVITIVAGQPPTVASGSTVNVVTPEGQPNTTVTV
jgi:hypothetical protein